MISELFIALGLSIGFFAFYELIRFLFEKEEEF